ncbi:MAG: hypothetical protein M1813_001604 [Trichoglossum hirsutum]|nr:MAG: hypothetical protein M1813_001604 [Trichoglossum hirsutum]
MSFLRLPEIENTVLFESILADEANFCSRTSIDLLEVRGDERRLRRDLDDESLSVDMLSQSAHYSAPNPDLRVFFLSRPPEGSVWNKMFHATSTMVRRLCETQTISIPFVIALYEPEIWSGNAYFSVGDEYGKPVRVGGTRSHTYFAADFTRKTLTYLFIDFPSLAQTRLLNEVTAERPLAPDALIADLCLKGWKNILCHLRSETINFNRRIAQENENINISDLTDAMSGLHNLSRAWDKLTADLADFEERMEFLLEAHQSYVDTIQTRIEFGGSWTRDGLPTVCQPLRYLKSGSQISRRRALSFKDRTSIRINLVFNLSAQRGNQINTDMSKTNVQIAEFTSRISQEAQRDSSSMITLAAVSQCSTPSRNGNLP